MTYVANIMVIDIDNGYKLIILTNSLIPSCLLANVYQEGVYSQGRTWDRCRAILVIFYSGRDVGNLVAITLRALDTLTDEG